MKLLHDYLLAEPIVEEIKSSIIIPATVKKKENKSKVVEVAENLADYIGETVLHVGGIPIEIEGKKYLLLKKNDILATI